MRSIKKDFWLPEYEATLQVIITSSAKRTMNNLYKHYNSNRRETKDFAGCVYYVAMDMYHLVLDTEFLTHNTLCHELLHLTYAIAADRALWEEEKRALLQGYLGDIIFGFTKDKWFD